MPCPRSTSHLRRSSIPASRALAEALRRGMYGPPVVLDSFLEEVLVGRCVVATSPVGATDPDIDPALQLDTCWQTVASFQGNDVYPNPEDDGPWGPAGPVIDEALVGEAIELIDGLEFIGIDEVEGFLAEGTDGDLSGMLEAYQARSQG